MDIMDSALKNDEQQFKSICHKMKKLLAKKQSLIARPPQCIYPKLFISNYSYAVNRSFLQQNHVTLIISCVKIVEGERYQDICYEEILIKDQPQARIEEYFGKVYELLENHWKNSQGSAIISCFSGVSRSVTLIVSYLMKKLSLDYSQCLENLLKSYPEANPNSGFVAKLKKYGEELSDKYDNLSESEELDEIKYQKKDGNIIYYEENSIQLSKSDSLSPEVIQSSSPQDGSQGSAEIPLKSINNQQAQPQKYPEKQTQSPQQIEKQSFDFKNQNSKILKKEESQKIEDSSEKNQEDLAVLQQQFQKKQSSDDLSQVKHEVESEVKQQKSETVGKKNRKKKKKKR